VSRENPNPGLTGSTKLPVTNLLHLLTARLWVARLGESDVNRWWRTDGILGPDGAFVGPRVLPKTHPTARARIAFAVARHACDDRYPDPKAYHLFRLDSETEDRLDALLVEKLDDTDFWTAMMEKLEAVTAADSVEELLQANGIITTADLELARQAALGPGERSVPMREGASAEETVRHLAAGFIRSQPGELAVPYINGKR
jgi:hypothetical protein